MNALTLSRLKNLLSQTLYLLKGLIGFGSIIIIHELGHFFACKLFGVSTPLFSIGFGPIIANLIIGDTTFGIGMIPIGGYVFIDPTEFALQSYVSQITILCSGVIANLLAALAIYRYLGKSMQEYRNAIYHYNPIALYQTIRCYYQQSLTSLSILPLISMSIHKGLATFLPSFASLNILVAWFTFLPLPLSDGIKIVRTTIGQFTDISSRTDDWIVLGSLFLLLMLLGGIKNKNNEYAQLRWTVFFILFIRVLVKFFVK